MSSRVSGRRSSASATAGNPGARAAKATAQEKKRPPLGNLTNVVGGKAGAAADAKLSSSNSVANVKKGSTASLPSVNKEWGSVTKPTSNQFGRAIAHHGNAPQKENVRCPSVPDIVPTLVPQNPDLKYLDNPASSVSGSLHRRADDKLHISDDRDVTVSDRKKHCPTPVESGNTFDIDTNYEDPQLCATLACDIYKHLREAETKKRPLPKFMETTQKDIDTSMRAVLIDWLVEVTEEYRLVPETLYLTVNYIDRYLSRKEINRHKLQLLGVSCLLIASKYEEICAPQIEELCYITDNTYTKDEVLQMEASILSCLKFEMTAPTAKCFLRRFLLVSQVCHEGGPALHLEFLASYIAELSLLEYSLVCYVPSLIAASSIFLANFILKPTKNPWNTTLSYHTQYKPSELPDCVKVLHRLFRVGPGSKLPAIREKYSQHKYKFVAKRYCPPSIPVEFFKDASN